MKVALIHNEPLADRYQTMGESKAELGVMDEVNAVIQSLNELQYPTTLVSLSPPLSQVKKKLQTIEAEVIFNLFEGFDGSPETEGQVAAMIADLNIPFTGCPASALTLALDKAQTKKLLEAAGIPTPRYQILSSSSTAEFYLDYPCIVKPLAEDASHGISEDSVVFDKSSLERQTLKICTLFGGRAMVEEYIDGREFNTTVMGVGRLIVPAISEIVYSLPPEKPKILTFEAKWEENSLYFDHTKAVCPAQISEREQKTIGKIAKAAYKLVGCRGYARVDFRQNKQGDFKVLEVNPNPDITPGSGAALQASVSGMTYSQFVEKIIRLALKNS